MIKLPPIEKVYEAWSAIADGRVHLNGDNSATIDSSDYTRTYTVKYNPDNDAYSSNDNATFWRGYPGYPVLAVMMLQGRLPYDPVYAVNWKNINWNAINAAHKRDYAAAVRQVETERDIDSAMASERAADVMEKLQALPVKVKRLVN